MGREVTIELPKIMPAGLRKAELGTKALKIYFECKREIGRAHSKIAKGRS